MRWYEDPEFQLMSEKAEELRKKWEWKDGDHFYHPAQRVLIQSAMDYHINIPAGVSVIHSDRGSYGNCNYRIDEIAEIMWWLPSQEDLQEMVKPRNMLELHLSFHRWFKTQTHILYPMTKMWLAFVMHELYQKKWNHDRKEWEEIK